MFDAVIEGLRLAAEGYQPFFAHPRQMLRQRRLAERNPRLQFADAHLVRLQQQAQNQQAVLVGKRTQPLRRFRRAFAVKIVIVLCVHYVSLILGVSNLA